MIALSLKRSLVAYRSTGIFLGFAVLALLFLPGFLSWDVNLYAGLLLAPYICKVDKAMLSLRYLIPALTMLVIAIFIPVKSLYFIAMLLSILLLIENSIGKISDTCLFLLLLISPVFRSILGIVDFPVRLWLTNRVAALLDSIGLQATALGNQIRMDKYEFSVDPACAGLNMLTISLIISLFVLMHQQRQTGKKIGLFFITTAFLVTIGLNIISNFFRILILVMFKIMPGTFYHDFAGIICLMAYIILPLMLAIKPLVNRYGKLNDMETRCKETTGEVKSTVNLIRYPALHLAILVTLVFIASQMVSADTLVSAHKSILLPGFKKQELETGILKFENKQTLIYIKPAAYYIPGHDPKLCWRGSGYEFKNIKGESLGGYRVYTAILEKGRDKLYAAWWFDNGKIKSTDQLLWRWQGFSSPQNFYLVNVNAGNRQDLKNQVLKLLANTHFLE